jgi:signal recognition particle GTPase
MRHDNALGLINKRLHQKSSDRQNGRQGSQAAGPILLVGGAGSGRTTGLHWLGWRLRLQGTFVLDISRSGDEIDHGAIEQIARLCETASLADSNDGPPGMRGDG